MNAPPPVSSPPPAPPATGPGSSADQGAAVGFLLAWAVAVGATVAGIAIGAAAAFIISGPAAVPLLILCALLPLGSVIGLIVWFSTEGRPRAMRGAVYALLSQIAILLLVAGGLILLFANADFR